MNELLRPTFEWIQDDFKSSPFRFFVELLLGLLVLAAPSIWQQPSLTRLYLLFTLYGSAAVLCMLGLLLLGNRLGCLLTTYC